MTQLNAIASFCEREKEIIYLNLDEIEINGGTQQRVRRLDFAHVERLSVALSEKEDLEPVSIVSDGKTHWLVDGFHRLHAYKNQARLVIPCQITEGTLKDAILASVAANAKNLTLPRRQEDIQKAIETMLNDPEWSQWSDREIARQVGCTHPTVSSARKKLLVNLPDSKIFSRNGTTAVMNTENIGQRSISQKVDINDFTAKGGHIHPKSALGPTKTPLKKSSFVKPDPVPKEIQSEEWLKGFLSWLPDFSDDQILTIQQKLQEVMAVKKLEALEF